MNASEMIRELSLLKAGWHRQENPKTGAVAIFCMTARSEAEWEQRAIAQSQAADRDTIILRPKAPENSFATRRGD